MQRGRVIFQEEVCLDLQNKEMLGRPHFCATRNDHAVLHHEKNPELFRYIMRASHVEADV
jgi:UDP-N-acetyl-D-mannosaminuronic acid transferase (WecB/TagA/CpsF family)